MSEYKIILIVLVLFICGCSEEIDHERYSKVAAYCDKHGGVIKITQSDFFHNVAFCSDGFAVRKHNVKATKGI